MVAVRYVLNPALLVYTTSGSADRRLVIETDSREPGLVVDDPRLVSALLLLPPSFQEADATDLWAHAFDESNLAPILWGFCISSELIVEEEHALRLPELTRGYHEVTRSYPFMDMSDAGALEADNALMRTYATNDLGPSAYFNVELPGTMVPLRKADEDLDLALFGDAISLLFDGVFGERAHVQPFWNATVPYVQLELLFKSVPSGGARHPTECFAYVHTAGRLLDKPYAQLTSGAYHYEVRANALHLLGDGLRLLANLSPSSSRLQRALIDDREFLIFVLSSRVERAMWRYRDPRSFRAVVIDVGHAVQQLVELADHIGFEYIEVLGGDTRRLAAVLGLEDEHMPVVTVGLAVPR